MSAPSALRRSGVRLLVVLGILLVLIWAAPIVAAWSPFVSWVCDKAGAYFGGSVQVGNVSLGWFSPVVLTNVEIRDASGQPIAQLPRVESDRILLRLLWNRDDLGSFRIDKPTIVWTFQRNGSNLEKVLAQTLRATEDAQPTADRRTLPQIQLQVVDAILKIRDDDTKQSWVIPALSLNVAVLNDEARTVQLNVQATLNDGREPGSLKAEAQLKNLDQANPTATVKGRFASLPLGLTNVLLRRFQPDTQLEGSLQGQCSVNAAIKDGKPYVEIVGEMIANQVTLTSPHLAEPFFSEHVKVPYALLLDDQTLIAQRIELECDFAKAAVQGRFDLGGAWRAALEQPDFELALEVNLATLAERFPRTLHLHDDLRLTAGQLIAQCKSQTNDGQVVWTGKLHVSDLRGIKANQTIHWTEPIALEFQARDLSKGVPLIDRLNCSARFLRVEGSTTADRFILTVNADLQQLAEPLGQFIDLGAMKPAGKANGTVVVRRTEHEQFLVQGDVQVKQLNLSWLTKEPWREESVAMKFDARGQLGAGGQQRIETANLDVRCGGDTATLRLTEPIAEVAAGPWGSLLLRIDGDLARWRQRARSWTSALDDWQLAGQVSAQAQIRPTGQALECASVSLQARDLRCVGPNLWIQEPTLQVQTAAHWDVKTGNLVLMQTKLNCPALQAEADKLSLQLATPSLRGAVEVTGDLGRLRQWTQDPKAKPAEPMAGTLVGKVDVQTVEQRVIAEFDGALRNFIYGAPTQPTWREAEVKCVGRAAYDVAKDVFHVEKVRVASAMLDADVQGTIARWTTTKEVDLTGTLAYDLEKLEPQLRPLLGKDVKIAGKDRRAFKVAGPLYPAGKTPVIAVSITGPTLSQPVMSYRELKGEASLNWKSLQAHGCEVGPAEVKAVLQQGWFQLYPIETTLNGGKLRLQPNVKLEPEPMELVLLAGPVIEKAKITPEMCAGALGYAMPALANVTAAEGSISVTLEGGRIPLAAPTTGEVKGTLVLHSAKVGPNPIVRELAGLLKMAPPTGVVKECSVPFHLANGKVHHSNLEIALNEVTIRMSGDVGLDGALALVIEMPIPPRLAAAAKLTPAQAKQLLRIPIGGTLEQPRVDARALESLTSVLGRSLLENELNKLLQPKR